MGSRSVASTRPEGPTGARIVMVGSRGASRGEPDAPAYGDVHRRLRAVAVIEHLEADQLIDVTGGQRSLVELHAELLHPNRGDVDHRFESKTR